MGNDCYYFEVSSGASYTIVIFNDHHEMVGQWPVLVFLVHLSYYWTNLCSFCDLMSHWCTNNED